MSLWQLFLTTLLMNKSTNVVTLTYLWFIRFFFSFLFLHLNHFVMKYCHEWLEFGWKNAWWVTLCPKFFLQGMINYVRWTFGVGDTTWVIYNQSWERQTEDVKHGIKKKKKDKREIKHHWCSCKVCIEVAIITWSQHPNMSSQHNKNMTISHFNMFLHILIISK